MTSLKEYLKIHVFMKDGPIERSYEEMAKFATGAERLRLQEMALIHRRITGQSRTVFMAMIALMFASFASAINIVLFYLTRWLE
jgi:hypothetical protein